MIQYSLKCKHGHQFESWFQSASAFDKLKSAGLLNCAICGANEVEKVLMAPAVRPARNDANKTPAPIHQDTPEQVSLTEPSSPEEKLVSEMRRHVESTSEYVGTNFAARAREMHDGGKPEKPIYGEAKIDEARKLIDDGIPVLPLPFRPTNKDN